MLFAMKSSHAKSLRQKRTLTLLEVVIAMVLLGILLTGLFNVFHQGLKKSIAAKEIKQQVLELELFEQRMKTVFAHKKAVWLDTHPEASCPALFISFEEMIDPEFEAASELLGMLYFDQKKLLNFVTWSGKEQGRVETLLDTVNSFQYRLFDAEQGEWTESWPRKKEEAPVMVSIKLKRDKKEIPFVFFLSDAAEQIIYSGPS